MDDILEPRLAKALLRYQVISAYLALNPKRGQRRAMLDELASKHWTGLDGEPFTVSAETIRVWIRRYRHGGLEGLKDKPRERRGVQVLTPEQIDLVCALKQEVPERSLDRLIMILEDMELTPPGTVRRSTLHRALKARGLSKRGLATPDREDLDRFEADAPNDIWQSDMLTGPWLDDPERPGHSRRAYLYAFIDDHSRLLLHGRFSFKGDLPALELVFRRSLQKNGVCRRVYYDNGLVYRSHHMRQIIATLGIHRIIFTKRYRPMGHGKIEALNQTIRNAFLAELKSSNVRTLDQLNEAFVAWSDLNYNRKVHSETGQTPLDRWRAGVDKVRYADEEDLRQAFLWREKRTPDKTGIFSLFGCRYQVGPELARRRVEVRYDPEALHEVEVWHNDRFVERVRPFEIHPNRRPRKREEVQKTSDREKKTPTVDWLAHLVKKRQAFFIEPSPQQLAERAIATHMKKNQAIVDLLAERLDPQVFDEHAIRDFLDRYGPFDVEDAERILEQTFEQGPWDQHVSCYLDAILTYTKQGEPS